MKLKFLRGCCDFVAGSLVVLALCALLCWEAEPSLKWLLIALATNIICIGLILVLVLLSDHLGWLAETKERERSAVRSFKNK